MIKSKLFLMAFTVIASQAFAGTTSTNFQSTATLSSSCVVSATTLAFGVITPASTGVNKSTSNINVLCTKDTSYTLALSTGNGTYAQRHMVGTNGNTNKLNYNIYVDSSYPFSDIWGDGTNNTANVWEISSGTTFNHVVYGVLPLNQYLQPDNYSDNLTVSLTY